MVGRIVGSGLVGSSGNSINDEEEKGTDVETAKSQITLKNRFEHECDIRLLKPLDRTSPFNMHVCISSRYATDNI